VPENPTARPIVQTVAEDDGKCPVFGPVFLQKALSLVRDRADRVRGEISTDWPDAPRNQTTTALFVTPFGAMNLLSGTANVAMEKSSVLKSLRTFGIAPVVAHPHSTSSTRRSGAKIRENLCRQ